MPCPYAILAATEPEMERVLEAVEAPYAVTGVGEARAVAGLRYLVQAHGPRVVLLVGFSGGLDAQARVGSVYEPTWFLHVDGRVMGQGGRAHLTTDQLVATPQAKRELAQRFGAWAVDMETFAVVEEAKRLGVALRVIRVVGDAADESVPSEAMEWLDERGRVRMHKVVLAMAKKPTLAGAVRRLERNASVAGRALAEAVKQCAAPVLLFGGSFDPPTRAHLELPWRVAKAVEAQAVWYIPAAQSPHKPDEPGAEPGHRLAMLRLALGPDAVIVEDELRRGGVSYTIDTLAALPPPGPGGYRLLIGTDQLLRFDQWKDWPRIVELAEPLVMVRPPQTPREVLRQLPGALDRKAWASRLIEIDAPDLSSTQVRGAVRAGGDLSGLVPPPVAQYIREHGLYR